MLKSCLTNGIWLLLAVVLSIGCTSSKKMLKRGDYYSAVMTATERLKKSPGNNKAQKALKAAYPLAVQHFQNEISHARAARDPWQWSITADSYQSLNSMYEAIQSTPRARQLISRPLPFYKEYGEVKEKAAAEQYNAAQKAFNTQTREGAREAYYFFQKADSYVPGYKDARRKIAEAKEMATLKVVLEFVSVPSRFYQVSADFFYDQVSNYLRGQRHTFVAFYTPQEAKRYRIKNPDHYLRLQFEDFVVGQTHTLRETETVTSEDSVKVGEVTLDNGNKKAVFDRVTAKLTTTRVEVVSGGMLGMEVVDGYSQASLYRDMIRGEFTWFNEWGSFKGDERALTAEEHALCQRQASQPPPPQDLFIEFTKPIYDQLIGQINRFYRAYV